MKFWHWLLIFAACLIAVAWIEASDLTPDQDFIDFQGPHIEDKPSR
jgi:hypothetical protein